MSILSSLVHHEIHDLPNEVHNTKPSDSTHVSENKALTGEAQKRLHSIKSGNVRPAMYYSEDVRRPCKNGAWQDSHTVESELELREETPRG